MALNSVIDQADKQIIMRALAFAAGMAANHGNHVAANEFRRMYNRCCKEAYGPDATQLPLDNDVAGRTGQVRVPASS